MKVKAAWAAATALLGVFAIAAASVPALVPTLKIGDAAPPVNAAAWIKGQPVTRFEAGQVYVVEFWATWCGPCNQMMPHLSALQKKHQGKVTVIGVNVREAEHASGDLESVRKFVAKKGDDMAYTVAVDDPSKKTVFDAWMTAGGSYGIPTAFVIDRAGKLVWMGHPSGGGDFDAVVENALNGTSDLEAARALQAQVNEATAIRLQKMKAARPKG